jgi:hypothetical protein
MLPTVGAFTTTSTSTLITKQAVIYTIWTDRCQNITYKIPIEDANRI